MLRAMQEVAVKINTRFYKNALKKKGIYSR
jgi:hypothetical protein